MGAFNTSRSRQGNDAMALESDSPSSNGVVGFGCPAAGCSA
jgi:hypothetical protein